MALRLSCGRPVLRLSAGARPDHATGAAHHPRSEAPSESDPRNTAWRTGAQKAKRLFSLLTPRPHSATFIAMTPSPQKTEIVRTRIDARVAEKARKRIWQLRLDGWADYIRRLILRDVGDIKEL